MSSPEPHVSQNYLMANYRRLPVAFTHGRGAMLFDDSGREYLDALSGIAVCNLGHAHPEVTAAIAEQAGQLLHTSNIYRVANQERLAERLCSLTSMEGAFFCNSGAEANEAAIKLARCHGHAAGIKDPIIVTACGAFHGRTMGALSAASAGESGSNDQFRPLLQGFLRVPYNDVDALAKVLQAQPRVVAVLLEPVQGEGGINVPSPDYLAGVRALCDHYGCLLMVDEVQCGVGRTGQWFGHQHEAVLPDVIAVAKALGNGVPIGACLARGPAASRFTPGSHGSTFGGNPFAARVGLTVLEICERDAICQRAAEFGERIRAGLSRALANCPGVVEVRGRGMMVGVELSEPCGDLVGAALDRGLLLNVTAGSVIRLLPPLVITTAQAERIVTTVTDLVTERLERVA